MPFLTLILGRSLAQWSFPILTQIFGSIGKSQLQPQSLKVILEVPQFERGYRQMKIPQYENFGFHWQKALPSPEELKEEEPKRIPKRTSGHHKYFNNVVY